MKQYKITLFAGLLSLIAILTSCRKWLDEKPNASMVVPATLQDCQLLLDDYFKMNAGYPVDGEAAADNYYVTDVNFNSATDQEVKNNYIWDPQAHHINQWNNTYGIVYNANLVLDVLSKLNETGGEYNRIKGSALFFRAFAFYHLAQLFTKPYGASTANTDPGIPLRLVPDVDIKMGRGTVQQTYDQILSDLNDALVLLPVTSTVKSRPNKVAVYAALARVHLTMENYTQAQQRSGEALTLHNALMNFNTVSTIPRFNEEVIFHAITGTNALMSQSVAKIDTALYNSYASNDRRRTVYFRPNTGVNAGTFAFRGSFDGPPGANVFTGLATDELFLIRAECYARAGNTADAMTDLNTLLRKRYNATFVDKTANDPEEALRIIIAERRKELPFRNQRWTDLRRLNKDPRFAITLQRNRNAIPYAPLVPGDLRYTMLIPLQEISLSGIEQNPR